MSDSNNVTQTSALTRKGKFFVLSSGMLSVILFTVAVAASIGSSWFIIQGDAQGAVMLSWVTMGTLAFSTIGSLVLARIFYVRVRRGADPIYWFAVGSLLTSVLLQTILFAMSAFGVLI